MNAASSPVASSIFPRSASNLARRSSQCATSGFPRALRPRRGVIAFAQIEPASDVVHIDNAYGYGNGNDSRSDEGLGLTFLVHRVKIIADDSARPIFKDIYEAFPQDPYVDPSVGRSRTYSDLLYFPASHAGGEDHVRRIGKDEDPFSQHFVPPESYKFVGREGEEGEAVDGSKARRFEPLPYNLVDLPQMRELLRRFVQYVRLDGEQFAYNRVFRIGCHAIRISAAPGGEPGDPAPEGIHQDGFDYIAIAVVGRHNVSGGEILVHMPDDDDTVDASSASRSRTSSSPPFSVPVFSNALRPGELVFLNDRDIWHNANKINCVDEDQGPGHVDFLVLTLDGELNRPIFPWELEEARERKRGDIAERRAKRVNVNKTR